MLYQLDTYIMPRQTARHNDCEAVPYSYLSSLSEKYERPNGHKHHITVERKFPLDHSGAPRQIVTVTILR